MSPARSIAPLIPPPQWAPISTCLIYFYGCPSPHGAEPNRVPAHRERPHGALQLALRATPRRRVPPPHREHGHEPGGGGGYGPDPGVARLARPRLGRAGHLPARPAGTLPAGGAPPGRGGEGLRGQRGDSDRKR